MSRIIGLAIWLLGLVIGGSAFGLVGFGMGGPLGAALLFAIGGFVGFFVAVMVWRRIFRSQKGQ